MPDSPGRPGPKYRVIADDLISAIGAGEYQVGDRLPTKAELQERYGVALNTVDRAMEELRRAGLVRTEQGAGTFVTAAPEPSAEYLDVMRQLDDLAEQVRQLRE